MSIMDAVQIIGYLAVTLVAAVPLGTYMARVYQHERTLFDPVIGPVERFIYRVSGIENDKEMTWQSNAVALLIFNFVGFVALYVLQRVQGSLPLNPQGFPAVGPDTSFNTAVSFVSNTNWQSYGGETSMSYLTQMSGLTVQNFLSAASGMAVLVLIIRGVSRHSMRTLGNFWVDMTRSVLYVLLPASMILAMLLVSQGVIQNLSPYVPATQLEATRDATGTHHVIQLLPMGPAASQIAIKQLGTNGGGFFNANSAHPFENPTPLSNMLEMLAIILLPAALCVTFGVMVRDKRQGYALLATMMVLFAVFLSVCVWAEHTGNPVLEGLPVDQTQSDLQPGGNMEGKELRFGTANAALWATATTAASNGSVNAMHASFTPVGATVTLIMMQLGEVVFGGVGSGLYGMLVFVIIAVFVAGLVVGRTPEYLGHKIEVYEMKMASLLALIMPVTVLLLTACAVMLDAGTGSIFNPGPRGFSEVLYAFTSMGNNNGSAFAGLQANTPFYNVTGGIAMLIGRYWLAIPMLALAGSLARKKYTPVNEGTLPTHTPLFVFWLIGIVLMVGGLCFLPALALGPIVEQYMLPV